MLKFSDSKAKFFVIIKQVMNMIKITQLKCPLDTTVEDLNKIVAKKLKIDIQDIHNLTILKESIDARKEDCFFVYTVACEVKNEEKLLKKRLENISSYTPQFYEPIEVKSKRFTNRPIVIGFGPGGIFAALILAEAGLKPLVFERGSDMDTRIEKVERFWKTGELDTECNVQFGEGGAGTFSDGKLTTRIKDPRIIKVNDELIEAGADEEIRYSAHPHIGTDHLRRIVKNLRKKIEQLGGEIFFDAAVTDFVMNQDEIMAVKVKDQFIYSNHVILAIGHSAQDTFIRLNDLHVAMQAKNFAVGVRVEHLQSLINKTQYGGFASHPRLKAAEYRLTHTSSNGRGVYSFCMCPGGTVVPSSSEKEHLVINGMSYKARDGINANSAILVQVTTDDFGKGVLDGLTYQRNLEKRAYQLGGGDFSAPVQRIEDFLNHQCSDHFEKVLPTYSLKTRFVDFHRLFSKEICQSLEEGFRNFDKKIPGFAGKDAIMTGIESRSSSPIRINRDESYQSINVKGLFPCGEGAGYAGGIVSSALDGIRCAEALIQSLK